jgi:hypothetical protein
LGASGLGVGGVGDLFADGAGTSKIEGGTGKVKVGGGKFGGGESGKV